MMGRLRFAARRSGDTPGVRTVYTAYWLIIVAGIVLWIGVGLTVE
jgi:hypothetical protein